MKCLILADEKRTGLGSVEAAPLIPLLGIPLIERVIRSAIDGGADDFYIITGYKGEKVSNFLISLSKEPNIKLKTIQNYKWEKESGFLMPKIKEILTEPFLALTAYSILDSSIIKSLINFSLKGEGELFIAVDPDLNNPVFDMKHIDKVYINNGQVLNIGRDIDKFNTFNTGCYLFKPGIFSAMEQARKKSNSTSISGVIRILSELQCTKAVKTHGLWMDIYDEKSFKGVEKLLLASLRGKIHDGPVSRWINRPMSAIFSKYLVKLNITPNQISLFSFMLSLLASSFFTVGEYIFLAIGGVMTQLASIIDGSDGEVARLKYMSSDYGGWFDAVLDRYADAFLLFGLTCYVYNKEHTTVPLFIGFLAIVGSFMLSYTADKYDYLMRNSMIKRIRVGRDLRLFLIFLLSVLNKPLWGLVVIGFWGNIEAVRRIIICRKNI